ncbi:oxidoreductase, short chain dehydrogenase/reductase family protein [Gemella bergeri ATCC 700627]|uniref:Oxidoreductase, short chain dehydrogenase/reductase family protein n=1 Tax=Gemella bergeri ATCC 700627 TaxID=1321820 RepID=U2Q4I4_9BACL|nr:SDR family oxidoreductase [Gemella bergeri]ERK57685.1 oxidoreductase, short chain dehydrogenase/reductase family protein [Gemella bergeri ATCC 700627]
MGKDKKTIVITGASSGIGRELAYQFAEKGNVHLILVSRRKEALDKVAKKCETFDNVTTNTYSVDIGDKEQVDKLIEKLGNIDILINGAGFGIMKEFSEFNDYEVVKMFDTNVIGTIQLTNEIAKKMREKKSGTIVTIASLSGKIATQYTSIYSATKFALIGYCNSLRLELKEDNVHVMTVNPGPVATNFFGASDENKKYLKKLGDKTITPKSLCRKIIVGIERKKREVNTPIKLALGAKINMIFPKLGDKLIYSIFKKQ